MTPGAGGASNAGVPPLVPVLFVLVLSVPPPQETKNIAKKVRAVSAFMSVFENMTFIDVLWLIDPEPDTCPQGPVSRIEVEVAMAGDVVGERSAALCFDAWCVEIPLRLTAIPRP